MVFDVFGGPVGGPVGPVGGPGCLIFGKYNDKYVINLFISALVGSDFFAS